MSSRGTVFFDTVVRLVPEDQNLTDDVYEFNGGDVRLVSAGTGSNTAKIENASATAAASSSPPRTRSPRRTKSRV